MNKELEYEDFSPKMQALCDKWEEVYNDKGLDYKDCKKFLEEAEEIGYTFEYGLDAEPFNFQVEDILLNKDLK